MSALKSIFIFILMTFILCLIFSCAGNVEQPGTLEGTVRIGPIWPVERPGENPPVSPEVFKARKIMVYNEHRDRLVETVDIVQIGQSQQGRYSVQLKPGKYIVDINRIGIDSSGEVPREVKIEAGKIAILDIDIDTGIR